MKNSLTALLLITNFAFAENTTIENSIKKIAPNINISEINTTPIKGLSEVIVSNGISKNIYYMTDDGKYFVNGQIIEVASKKDLTNHAKSALRKEALAKQPEAARINFYPENMKHKVTVFTDVDCGYCRKLHNEIKEFNDLGIGISYLFFPRAGLNSTSFNKAVSVWCSEDKNQSMTDAQSGSIVDAKTCDNPIANQFNIGQAIGVNGTPNIVTEDGDLIPTYMPANLLLERLNQLADSRKN